MATSLLGELSSIGIGVISAIAGLGFVVYLARRILKKDPGSEHMVSISKSVQEGAMAFLKREYRSIGIFVLILGGILLAAVSGSTAMAFVTGAACSVLAG